MIQHAHATPSVEVVRTLGVIPARMGSSRFPGKPLASLAGRPMIEHVYTRTVSCRALDEVVIATCDVEIAAASKQFGGKAVMTSSLHERASDRVAEVSAGDPAAIVVMVQGDEPMIEPAMIDAVIVALKQDDSLGCANLMAPIASADELRDPNTIKVVTDHRGRALYFSRAPIPAGSFTPGGWFKQVCVIGFRRDALAAFRQLPQGPLERLESVDMLRFLEHGLGVQMVPTDSGTHAVDTPADLARVEALMSGAAGQPSPRP